MRVVFMGSPDFAVPSLRWLASAYEVVGVVTQPDRPAGRGRRLVPPPIKRAAVELGLDILQPQRLREPGATEAVGAWQPELIVVAAFGQILRPDILQLPSHGCVNLHASLLPRHRGAAPIPAAILAGDSETGITLMRMDEGLDTGPILAQERLTISAEETALSLGEKLSELAKQTAERHLPQYLAGKLPPSQQDDALATYAPMLRKDDSRMDLAQPAEALAQRVRAYYPWPGTHILWERVPLKITRARALRQVNGAAGPVGRVVRKGTGAAVTCGVGELLLLEVQPPGKKPMAMEAFLNGSPDFLDAVLD
ncbi:MAG TPA: methionyl-tRNA formyltransferase [Anaerolineales bacterium]|nr:methionyl-tRNA formyltransferase [Anaerolineales bacterium]